MAFGWNGDHGQHAIQNVCKQENENVMDQNTMEKTALDLQLVNKLAKEGNVKSFQLAYVILN